MLLADCSPSRVSNVIVLKLSVKVGKGRKMDIWENVNLCPGVKNGILLHNNAK
jgi:hypothetical protein